MKNLVPEHLGWRIKPGILGQHASSPQSVHALLGYFLKVDAGWPMGGFFKGKPAWYFALGFDF